MCAVGALWCMGGGRIAFESSVYDVCGALWCKGGRAAYESSVYPK